MINIIVILKGSTFRYYRITSEIEPTSKMGSNSFLVVARCTVLIKCLNQSLKCNALMGL